MLHPAMFESRPLGSGWTYCDSGLIQWGWHWPQISWMADFRADFDPAKDVTKRPNYSTAGLAVLLWRYQITPKYEQPRKKNITLHFFNNQLSSRTFLKSQVKNWLFATFDFEFKIHTSRSVNFEMCFWYLQFCQKHNEEIQLYNYGTSSPIVFVRFLGELNTPNRDFEIIWPIVQV